VPVEKKSKRGVRMVEMKDYVPALTLEPEGESVSFAVCLPAAQELNLNPSLLTDFLRTQGAAPVWQCRVLRTHLYNKAGKDFE